jgi:hypothetical protein
MPRQCPFLVVYPLILGRSLCRRHCEVGTGENSQQEIRCLRRSVCTFAIISCFISHDGFNSRNANATIQCPVERGSYILEQTVALPKEIPKGKLLRNYTRQSCWSAWQPNSMLTSRVTLSRTMICYVLSWGWTLWNPSPVYGESCTIGPRQNNIHTCTTIPFGIGPPSTLSYVSRPLMPKTLKKKKDKVADFTVGNLFVIISPFTKSLRTCRKQN